MVSCSLLNAFKLVFDASFLAPFPSVVRWFTASVSQPEFLAVLGPTELLQPAAAPPAAKGAKAAAPAKAEKGKKGADAAPQKEAEAAPKMEAEAAPKMETEAAPKVEAEEVPKKEAGGGKKKAKAPPPEKKPELSAEVSYRADSSDHPPLLPAELIPHPNSPTIPHSHHLKEGEEAAPGEETGAVCRGEESAVIKTKKTGKAKRQ
jgi:hypothetical protein